MAILVWNPAWETGEPEIDRQHRLLMAAIERLFKAVSRREDPGDAAETLHFLADYAESHFRMEEALMARSGYPGAEAHRALHDGLRADIARMLEAHRLDPASVSEEMPTFLSDWLISHIGEEDRALVRHLRAGPDADGAP